VTVRHPLLKGGVYLVAFGLENEKKPLTGADFKRLRSSLKDGQRLSYRIIDRALRSTTSDARSSSATSNQFPR